MMLHAHNYPERDMPKTLYLVLLLFLVVATTLASQARAQETASLTQQLFLIKEIKPSAVNVGVMMNAATAKDPAILQELQRAGASAGVKVFVGSAGELKDVAPVFRDLTRTNQIHVLWVIDESGVVTDDTARGFLIKTATQSGIPVFGPSSQWVSEGACVNITKAEGIIQLVVNRTAAQALSLTIPQKYLERTQFLALN